MMILNWPSQTASAWLMSIEQHPRCVALLESSSMRDLPISRSTRACSCCSTEARTLQAWLRQTGRDSKSTRRTDSSRTCLRTNRSWTRWKVRSGLCLFPCRASLQNQSHINHAGSCGIGHVRYPTAGSSSAQVCIALHAWRIWNRPQPSRTCPTQILSSRYITLSPHFWYRRPSHSLSTPLLEYI